jgi:hypothetical protein
MPINEEILEVIISDFRDGIVSNIDDPDKPNTGFKEIKNSRFDIKGGEIHKRKQSAYYNDVSLGSHPVKSGARYYYGTDSKELIISYDTLLKKGDDEAGTFSNIATTLTSDKRWCFLEYKDKLYGCNGVDSNRRYDGTDSKVMGCQIPPSTFTVTKNATGVLPAGTFKYKITFLYDGYQESNPNATEKSVTTDG